MPNKKITSSSSNLIGLATLWVSAVTTDAACRGAWGTSHAAARYHHSNRNSYEATELVRDLFYMPTYPNSLMRPDGSSIFGEKKSDPQPHFDISTGEDGTTTLIMEVPGISARDLNIELENDHVLRVSGIRTRRKNGYVSQTEFDQSIRLSDNDDVDNLKVNLTSGVLTIAVPRKPTKIKKLPIHSDDHGSSILDPPTTCKQNETNHEDSDII